MKEFFTHKKIQDSKPNNAVDAKTDESKPSKAEGKVFSDQFSTDYTLDETGKMEESKNPNWWLNSGAIFYVKDGIGHTVYGNLEANLPIRLRYNKNNPEETDNGFHPQNIFRLVTKSQWKNFEQQVYYKVVADNLSADTHRAASNGLLLFNRYQDGNNLYYTGLRVDGTAVIKKKINGEYFLMGQQTIIDGKYDRASTPNLLPKNKWLGLKSVVSDNPDGTVNIELYTDLNNTQNWTLVLKTKDDGVSYGGNIISNPGYAGMRTDFMDVAFDNYKIEEK